MTVKETEMFGRLVDSLEITDVAFPRIPPLESRVIEKILQQDSLKCQPLSRPTPCGHKTALSANLLGDSTAVKEHPIGLSF